MTATQITLAPSVLADLLEIDEPIKDVLRDLANGFTPCVSHTPNGREVRVAKDGQSFEVQPRNDNYWISVPTIDAALEAFDDPAKFH